MKIYSYFCWEPSFHKEATELTLDERQLEQGLKRIQEPDYTIVCIKIACSDKSAAFIPMHLQIKASQGGIRAGTLNGGKKIRISNGGAFEILRLGMSQMDFAMLMARKHVFPILPQAITFFN